MATKTKRRKGDAPEPMTTITMRIDRALYDAAKAEAALDMRPVSQWIRKVLHDAITARRTAREGK